MSTDRTAEVNERLESLLAMHDPTTTPAEQLLGARFDAGLAWVHFPTRMGGLGASRSLQGMVETRLVQAGWPPPDAGRNGIGLGMAAPTLVAYGTPEQQQRFLRPLFTSEETWCQLFSEPGAGSDLAALATRAVRDDATGDWVVNGQKVWTSGAHTARFAILVARTDPAVPKHEGLTYFVCDMHQPGVEVRPLRQLTGEAEFNEVFLTDARVPDAHRVGNVGEGWRVATATLDHERLAIGGGRPARESGMVGRVSRTWRENPPRRTPGVHDRLPGLGVAAVVAGVVGVRLGQRLAAGGPGAEGSAVKLVFARLAQQLSGLEVELLADDGLRYSDWTMRRPDAVDFTGRDAGYRYLRAKGNSIEGGTSEILRNILAERVLGLPPEPRADRGVPWKEIPR